MAVLFRKVRALQDPEFGWPVFHTPARCCSFTAIGASYTLAAGCNDLVGNERRAVSRRDSPVLLRSDGLALWLSCRPASSGISVFAPDQLATFRETSFRIQRPLCKDVSPNAARLARIVSARQAWVVHGQSIGKSATQSVPALSSFERKAEQTLPCTSHSFR